ncbi:MAG TPA: hypothetical protein VD866_14795 [Urbifossiella sp.]|nr:hypothetical protein [Urbifossiella sp.]
MPDIVLTEEQVRVLASTTDQVTVRGPDGTELGSLEPRYAELMARHRRRKATPRDTWYTSEQMRAQFDALQAERDRIGPFDAEYALTLLARLEQENPEVYGPTRRSA